MAAAKIPIKFAFLEKMALELGAFEATLIPAGSIVVEDRVIWKCRNGCSDYGRRLTCPPYVPSPDEFRKALKGYKYALLVKFRSSAVAGEDVVMALDEDLASVPEDLRMRVEQFWAAHSRDSAKIHSSVLELEKAAFNRGYVFALGFVNNSCRLCKTCNVVNGVCLHPERARMPEHAVGINMIKTAAKAGMPISFPIKGAPEPMALVLID